MEVFRTHPSVRVKGTEDNYEPITCNITGCAKRNIHLHCPFCIKTDSFYDPVILKAHYRVKHVDKGIEFAGLKILRCCDNCMIVGSIKGSKEFKGAHWHCYNCRNGFNRRDEALKHYKTHFRNPMTTFQIQITHDINQMMELSQLQSIEMQENQQQILNTVTLGEHSVMSSSSMPGGMSSWIMSTETVVSSSHDGAEDGSHVILTRKEPDAIENQNTSQITGLDCLEEAQYYIVGEDGQLTAADNHQLAITAAETDHVEICSTGLGAEKQTLMQTLTELEKKYKMLEDEKEHSEQALNNKITKLENKIQYQEKEIEASKERENELLGKLELIKDDTHVSGILNEMKSKQEELLNQYMSKLKNTVILPPAIAEQTRQSKEKVSIVTSPVSNSPVVNQIIVSSLPKFQGALKYNRVNSVEKGNHVNASSPIRVEKVMVIGGNLRNAANKNRIEIRKENFQEISPHFNNVTKGLPPRVKHITPVSTTSKVASKLPLSRFFEPPITSTSSYYNNSDTASRNINVITTDSGKQYMVLIDPAKGELLPAQEVSIEFEETTACDDLGSVEQDSIDSVNESVVVTQEEILNENCAINGSEAIEVYHNSAEEEKSHVNTSPINVVNSGKVCYGVSQDDRTDAASEHVVMEHNVENDMCNNMVDTTYGYLTTRTGGNTEVKLENQNTKQLDNDVSDENVVFEIVQTDDDYDADDDDGSVTVNEGVNVSSSVNLVTGSIKRRASRTPEVSPSSVGNRPKRVCKTPV